MLIFENENRLRFDEVASPQFGGIYFCERGVFIRKISITLAPKWNSDVFYIHFSERELKFMFAICHRRSICRLSSVCRL